MSEGTAAARRRWAHSPRKATPMVSPQRTGRVLMLPAGLSQVSASPGTHFAASVPSRDLYATAGAHRVGDRPTHAGVSSAYASTSLGAQSHAAGLNTSVLSQARSTASVGSSATAAYAYAAGGGGGGARTHGGEMQSYVSALRHQLERDPLSPRRRNEAMALLEILEMRVLGSGGGRAAGAAAAGVNGSALSAASAVEEAARSVAEVQSRVAAAPAAGASITSQASAAGGARSPPRPPIRVVPSTAFVAPPRVAHGPSGPPSPSRRFVASTGASAAQRLLAEATNTSYAAAHLAGSAQRSASAAAAAASAFDAASASAARRESPRTSPSLTGIARYPTPSAARGGPAPVSLDKAMTSATAGVSATARVAAMQREAAAAASGLDANSPFSKALRSSMHHLHSLQHMVAAEQRGSLDGRLMAAAAAAHGADVGAVGEWPASPSRLPAVETTARDVRAVHDTSGAFTTHDTGSAFASVNSSEILLESRASAAGSLHEGSNDSSSAAGVGGGGGSVSVEGGDTHTSSAASMLLSFAVGHGSAADSATQPTSTTVGGAAPPPPATAGDTSAAVPPAVPSSSAQPAAASASGAAATSTSVDGIAGLGRRARVAVSRPGESAGTGCGGGGGAAFRRTRSASPGRRDSTAADATIGGDTDSVPGTLSQSMDAAPTTNAYAPTHAPAGLGSPRKARLLTHLMVSGSTGDAETAAMRWTGEDKQHARRRLLELLVTQEQEEVMQSSQTLPVARLEAAAAAGVAAANATGYGAGGSAFSSGDNDSVRDASDGEGHRRMPPRR